MSGLAVESTQRALYYFGPSLIAQDYWESNKSKPGWLPRLQAAAGPRKTAGDPHAAGRALDIILFAKDPREKDYADRIIQVFLKLREKIKFISIVYNGLEWNSAGVKFPHVDEAHKTHIHIEWSKTGIALNNFASALEDALFEEFSGENIASGDYAVG